MKLTTATLLPKGIHKIKADINGKPLVLFIRIDKRCFPGLQKDFAKKCKPWVSQTIEGCNSSGRLIWIGWEPKFGVVASLKITNEAKGIVCPNLIADVDFKLAKERGGAVYFPPKVRGGRLNPCRPIGFAECVAHFSDFPSFKP